MTMPKKNKKSPKVENEQINDTSLANDSITESVAAEQEPVVLTPSTEPGMELAEKTLLNPQTASAEASQPEDESVDDLLEDVRRSLIEDETHTEEENQSKWWNRISKSSKGSKGSKGSRKAKADKPDTLKDEPIKEVPAPIAGPIKPVIESQKT